MRYVTPLLATTLLVACNAVFGLDPTREGDGEGAGAGGSGQAGAAGPASGAGSEGSSGSGGASGAGGGQAGAGATGGAGLGGEAGSTGAAGSAPQGGSGGQGGGEQCTAPNVLEQIKSCSKGECKGDTIRCVDGLESCEFQCKGPQSCEGTTFECPPDRDCRVICDGDRACAAATLNCGRGNCELICMNDQESCQDMHDVDCTFSKTCTVRCFGQQVAPPDVQGCDGRASSCPCDSNCS
jgi:hypothetical protein